MLNPAIDKQLHVVYQGLHGHDPSPVSAACYVQVKSFLLLQNARWALNPGAKSSGNVHD